MIHTFLGWNAEEWREADNLPPWLTVEELTNVVAAMLTRFDNQTTAKGADHEQAAPR